jgi:hypothetical protein
MSHLPAILVASLVIVVIGLPFGMAALYGTVMPVVALVTGIRRLVVRRTR